MIVDNTNIMPDASEVISYDDAGLPLYIKRGLLSDYPNMRAAAHWHEDFEWIQVEEGEMNYSINGEMVHLERGSCLFVNSRQLHFGFDEKRRDCLFICILVHPSLLGRDNALLHKYLDPMMQDSSFPYHYFPDSEETGNLLQRICMAKKEHAYGYRFEAVGLLTELTGRLLDVWNTRRDRFLPAGSSKNPQLDLQRRMVAFIEENFASELSLDQIAGSASVSRSTCCRLFRKYVHTSPIEFLNSYRLQVACGQLRDTDMSITDIASRCGFNHTSYFSQLFSESFGDTPRGYRKKNVKKQRRTDRV